MRKSLEFKMLAIVTAILLIGPVVAGFVAVYMQKATLYSTAESSSETTAAIILKDIESTMLEGNADITKELIENLKRIRGIYEITVFNYEGREAFKNDTAAQGSAVIKELGAGKDRILKRDGSRLAVYVPLKNHESCQRCHGLGKPLLGAIKVSVSIEKDYDRAMRMITVVIGGIVAASLCFSFFIWIMLRKMVVTPIKSMEAVAARISEGDLSFNVDIKSEDEIGRLYRIFKESFRSLGGILERVKELSGRISNIAEDVEKESKNVVNAAEMETEAIANISGSVKDLRTTTTEIAESTESLAVSMDETSASVEQVVASINSVNDNMQELTTAVETTSSSIEELSATIREVASSTEELAVASDETLSAISEITSAIREVELSARESARLSEKVASDAATFGISSVNKTIEGTKNIKSSVEHTADLIKRLGGRSNEIGNILNVIDEVTDQTSLLALNAAILAAQAGEHGRGFSVVAAEIKDLAERTAFSTQEIASLIKAVQQEVKDAGQAMDEGLRLVENGLRLSGEAGEALNKILNSSKKSSEMAQLIERSTTEQSKATKLVTDAMERVKNMIDQIAKATSEESEGILMIMKATEKMRDVSRHVSMATREQTVSGKQISQAVDLVSEKSQQISHSLSEQKHGAQHIFNIVDGVRGIPAENRKLAFGISNKLRNLHNDSELLKAEIERFRFYEKERPVLRFGIVPLESPTEMFRKFSPLAEYISKKLGKTVELRVAIDFDGAINDIGKDITQLCYMTPSTYIEAQRKYGIKVLVKALRDGKPYHRSVIITRTGSDISSIDGIKGRTFAFGDVKSTSSHIIPRSMLKDAGIDITDLQYYNYLGHHDEVARAVLKGDFDAGGVMESTAYKFKEQGLRLLKLSDEIPEFNICFNSAVDESDISIIKTALLSLSDSTPEGATILKSIDKNYTGFVEAKDSDYNDVRSNMSRLGVL